MVLTFSDRQSGALFGSNRILFTRMFRLCSRSAYKCWLGGRTNVLRGHVSGDLLLVWSSSCEESSEKLDTAPKRYCSVDYIHLGQIMIYVDYLSVVVRSCARSSYYTYICIIYILYIHIYEIQPRKRCATYVRT